MNPNGSVTFIYTNSFDATSDVLIDSLGSDKVFRFNIDLWRDYKIHVTADDCYFGNPTGKSVRGCEIRKFLWRKPMRQRRMWPDKSISPRDEYFEEEIFYVMREVANRMWRAGKLVLVEPSADTRVGKFIQAEVARHYFQVPEFKFVSNVPELLSDRNCSVVKSLSSHHIDVGTVLYTTRAQEAQLDPHSPWLIQQLIEAEKDITVAFIRDRLFAFELSRLAFRDRTLDWREQQSEASEEWPVHELPAELSRGIFQFMSDLDLHYGRLDFLYRQGSYFFLEVNANGEWGWLDKHGAHGLRGKILSEISPDTDVHPVPFHHTTPK